MLKQIDQENQQHSTQFIEELAQRREKQELLKAEQDHLRTLLTGMVQQFSMIGAVYSPASSLVPPVPTASAAESSSGSVAGSAASASGLEEPPCQLGYANGAFPLLPAMPDFPFPPVTGVTSTPATPLSLAEALGPEAAVASAVPVSLLGSLSHGVSPDTSTPTVFSFTLRKAENTDLGINVSHHEHDKVLWVEGIRAEGAVEAWNRQCISNAAAEKAVMPGDRIISVNAVIGQPMKMLEECRDKQLLKFTIERGGAAQRPSVVAAASPKAATTLRADADEFVPGGVLPEQPVPDEQ